MGIENTLLWVESLSAMLHELHFYVTFLKCEIMYQVALLMTILTDLGEMIKIRTITTV